MLGLKYLLYALPLFNGLFFVFEEGILLAGNVNSIISTICQLSFQACLIYLLHTFPL